MKTSIARDSQLADINQSYFGLHIGLFSGVDENGQVLVKLNGSNFGPITARFTKSIEGLLNQGSVKLNQKLLILFENGDPKSPVVVDILCDVVDSPKSTQSIAAGMVDIDKVYIDGERVTVTGKEKIELRCGKASITLSHSGKVLIRGAYLSNHSSGVNRIKGGSVQIN